MRQFVIRVELDGFFRRGDGLVGAAQADQRLVERLQCIGRAHQREAFHQLLVRGVEVAALERQLAQGPKCAGFLQGGAGAAQRFTVQLLGTLEVVLIECKLGRGQCVGRSLAFLGAAVHLGAVVVREQPLVDLVELDFARRLLREQGLGERCRGLVVLAVQRILQRSVLRECRRGEHQHHEAWKQSAHVILRPVWPCVLRLAMPP